MGSKDRAVREQALKVVCPRCGAWLRKDCRHTKGSKAGEICSPHPERIRFSQADVSPDTRRKIKEIEEAIPEKGTPKKKDKLTPEQRTVVDTLLNKIADLGKNAEFEGPVTVGPLVSVYPFFPQHRTKVVHLEQMGKDFAAALRSEENIVARRLSGAGVGIFVPNKERTLIHMPDTLPNVIAYMQKSSKDGHKKIPLNFGVTYSGEPFVDDLTLQPHILLAGSTDSGKSTLALSFLLSMCWAMNPRELQLIISDTKKVDFKPYFGNLPHLARPIAGDVYETMQALAWLNRTTQLRLDMLSNEQVRNIHEHNFRHPDKAMPYIVLYIDEMADIMGDQIDSNDAKANNAKLGALVQRCRAAGIYVIASTQRPSVNIVKGSIKANFPSRVSFKLPSASDSVTVLRGVRGAENLVSRGDMFYSSSARSDLLRLHSPFTKLEDVKTLLEAVIRKEEVEQQKMQQEAERAARINLEDSEERQALQEEGSNRPISTWDGKKVN